MANCSRVQPGGKEALVCLQAHAARLSPAGRTAVSAIGSAPKPAAAAAVATTPAAPAVAVAPAMPTAEQQAAIKNTCRADFMRNCRGRAARRTGSAYLPAEQFRAAVAELQNLGGGDRGPHSGCERGSGSDDSGTRGGSRQAHLSDAGNPSGGTHRAQNPRAAGLNWKASMIRKVGTGFRKDHAQT
jgi:hypothetical protein